MIRDIIILTKSDKHSGFCVAGIDTANGEWVRMVSSDEATEYAVPAEDIIYDDGKEIEIYDIVEIDLYKPVPTSVQPENYLYNESIKWRKKGKSNLAQVVGLHGYDSPKMVFGNTENRLTEENICLSGVSLLLLQVDSPKYIVKSFPERKVIQLNFSYRSNLYSFFKITQKELKDFYQREPDGSYIAGTRSFVFSLTDKYERDGKYYKVVAQALM